MQQIAPKFHTFNGLMMGRVYLIEDDDGLTLIDASIPPAGAKILRQIEGMGRKPSDVKRILITHGHPDHVGALPELKAATGAQVWTSAIDRPVIEGKAPVPRVDKAKATGVARWGLRPPGTTMKGTPIDREIGEGDVLSEVMGGIHVIATPGHSAGHLAFWNPEKRTLICGDVIMRFAWGLQRPFSFFTVDAAENDRSIRRVAELDAEVICFGHGNPITENTAQTIRSFAHKIGVL